MTDPITLTERERQVLAHAARTLGAGRVADDIIVSNAILHFLDADFRIRTESASPPRAPGASAQDVTVGVESGPGQPIDIVDHFETRALWHDKIGSTKAAADCRQAAAEIRRLREQVKAERRAGIYEAADWHDQQAAEWDEHYAEHGDSFAREYAKQHRTDAAAISALADKPAPDAARKGG